MIFHVLLATCAFFFRTPLFWGPDLLTAQGKLKQTVVSTLQKDLRLQALGFNRAAVQGIAAERKKLYALRFGEKKVSTAAAASSSSSSSSSSASQTSPQTASSQVPLDLTGQQIVFDALTYAGELLKDATESEKASQMFGTFGVSWRDITLVGTVQRKVSMDTWEIQFSFQAV